MADSSAGDARTPRRTVKFRLEIRQLDPGPILEPRAPEATHMTRFWTIPVLAAALTVGACSKESSQAQPPAGDPAAPPAAAAPPEPVPAAPGAAAPRAAAPARPSTTPRASDAAKPLQNSAAPPAVHEPPAPPKPTYHDVTVASGTQIPLELLTSLSSETAEVETEVQGRTKQAIVVGGETVIPNGATLTGNVTDVAS